MTSGRRACAPSTGVARRQDGGAEHAGGRVAEPGYDGQPGGWIKPVCLVGQRERAAARGRRTAEVEGGQRGVRAGHQDGHPPGRREVADNLHGQALRPRIESQELPPPHGRQGPGPGDVAGAAGGTHRRGDRACVGGIPRGQRGVVRAGRGGGGSGGVPGHVAAVVANTAAAAAALTAMRRSLMGASFRVQLGGWPGRYVGRAARRRRPAEPFAGRGSPVPGASARRASQRAADGVRTRGRRRPGRARPGTGEDRCWPGRGLRKEAAPGSPAVAFCYSKYDRTSTPGGARNVAVTSPTLMS